MPQYRRAYCEGGTYFFTVVTHERRRFFTEARARECLRIACIDARQKLAFRLSAVCLMPDHLHTIWMLPEDDDDFSGRWSLIKSQFSMSYREQGGDEGQRNASRIRKRERGYWQRRFWEHLIRDDDDFRRHMDYVHYNPVKHKLVARPYEWPLSTFRTYVERGYYHRAWGETEPPTIDGFDCPGEVD